MAKTKPGALFRLKIVRDKDARFEECNGEARPLTAAEYAENQYRACADHPGAPSHVDPQRPGVGICNTCGKAFTDVSYARYLAYQGNPKQHVYLAVVVDRMDSPTADWAPAGSLWRIDFMRDNPEADRKWRNRWLMPSDAIASLPGYLRDVAIEVLEESGWPVPADFKCTHAGCHYLRDTDGADNTKCAQHQA